MENNKVSTLRMDLRLIADDMAKAKMMNDKKEYGQLLARQVEVKDEIRKILTETMP